MFERMLQKTCIVVYHSEDDDSYNEYGDPVIDTSESDEIPCEVQQVRTDEDEDQGETATTTWTFYLPQDTELDTTDSIIFEGQVYQLVGEPEEYVGLNSRWGFVEAICKRTGKVPDESS